MFSKYEACGNDFIIFNTFASSMDKEPLLGALSISQIQQLCHRHKGIGADGLIVLHQGSTGDVLVLHHYNSDGTQGLCGNGARCGALEASMRWNKSSLCIHTQGLAISATVEKRSSSHGYVCLDWQSKDTLETIREGYCVGGSHVVLRVEDFPSSVKDLEEEGLRWREEERFSQGVNVNFVQVKKEGLFLRTYEKGVEKETLSCGTGAVAAVRAGYAAGWCLAHTRVFCLGGELCVRLEAPFSSPKVSLSGAASKVFEGRVSMGGGE